MPVTIREYLGDEKITQLENMGFLPNLIADMAKRQYMSDKQAKRNELSDAGLDGKLVQGIMRGEISEEEARNAQKFEEFGAKKHGWGLGAAKAVAGIANAAERVSDFINPLYEGKRDEKGDYVYQNAIEKGLRPKIKSAERLRDDYEKATGETSWGSRATEIGTEMVADPLNFFGGIGLLSKGSKLAQFGKKSLYFAGTGAASGGVMALGEGKNDEETLKNMGYGAAGGFVLGHAIDQSVQGISKLIAKRRASRAANEADAVSEAENSDFLRATDDLGGSEIKAADGNSDVARRGADEAVNTESSARSGEASDGTIKHSSSSQREVDVQTMTAREFATSEAGLDEATAAKVVKEATQGKGKSDFVDADTYADIVKFKNFENQRDYARAYGEQIEAAKQSLESAREQSAVRYAQTQKAINEYQKQGMSVSATRELINAKFKPGADEISYTRAYNGGADVDPRLAGQGIFYALEKDIAAQAYAPEIYAARLKQRGFSDESAQAFTQAYVQKDINIAKDYANGKVAEAYEGQIQKQIAEEIRARDEAETNGLRDSVSSIGDNASRAGGRQSGDEQILRQGRRDTANASQAKRPAQSDEQVEQQWAAKADGEVDAAATGEQVVEKQTLGSLKREYDVERFLRDRENVAAKDAKYGSKVSQKSDLITRWDKNGRRYEYVPPLKEKNYNADFLITKADVAKIRGGKADEAIIEKLRNDLQSSEHMGYDYKTTDSDLRGAYKDEGIDWSKKPQGMNDDEYVNDLIAKGKAPILFSNPHLGSGMVAGTLNSVDEDGNFSPERFAAGFLAGFAGSKAAATGLRKMTPKLYNQILGAAEKMPQMANGNPRLLGKLYSNGKDVSLNSFAGEKAITANVGKLDQAKAMLEKGADEAEIWQKTGWFKDKDGAWKFEIGDSNARLNPGFQSGGRLGELLEHEELFKAYPELKDVRVVKIGDEIPSGAALSVKDAAQREKRGIYNVTYNDKTATLVRQDLKNIDDALRYAKGDKSEGAKHIEIRHMKDQSAEGYVTKNELLNMGEKIREYLAKYKEPFVDKKGGHIYEWQNERGERFRAVIGKIKREQDVPAITSTLSPADEAAKKGLSPNSSLYSHNEIITFYSDRNLKDRMDFKNPKVKYDVNLSEWHKDSAPVTKNADGSPKVFYHGSLAKDITEFKSEFDNSGIGFWFADKDYAANHGEGNLYETFLRIKNPLDLREENAKYPFELMREMQRKGLSLEPYGKTSKEAKEFLKQNGYDGIVLNGDYKERPFVIAFDSAQIKHVENDGNFSDSPNIYKSGKEGYYSPAKNEIGLRDIGDKSTLMHEVQHAIQEIEDFARGGNMAEARSYLLGKEGRKYEQELNGIDKTLSNLSLEAQHMRMRYGEIPQSQREYEYAKELFRGIDNREKAYMELSVLRDDLSKKLFEIDKKIRLQDIRETYRKIHGEAEARNVENRLNLDGETHPHETFDINPNETIVSKEDGISYSRKIEEIKREHPNVEKELDESIAAMSKESFNDVNFKTQLLNKFDSKEITTQELGKSVNLSGKQLAVLKNDIKNADFKVINESKIYFDKIGKDGDKKRFFVDIAEDGSLRVDGYSKKDIDSIPVKQSALEELAGVGDKSRLKNMSFEVKAAYRNELDPIKKEAILKTAELNKLKKAAQSGDKTAAAKFEEFKARNLDENGNIKDGLSLC